MTVTIYSTTTCVFCKLLEEYLTSKNVTFTTKLIDQDDIAQKEMSEISNGFLGVPFTVFVDEDGTKETVLGFDRGKINSILGFT